MQLKEERHKVEFSGRNKLKFIEVSAAVPRGCTNLREIVDSAVKNSLFTLSCYPGYEPTKFALQIIVNKKDFTFLATPQHTLADLVKRETPTFGLKQESEQVFNTPDFDFEGLEQRKICSSSSIKNLELLIEQNDIQKESFTKHSDRFSFLPHRSQSSAFDLASLFKSDKGSSVSWVGLPPYSADRP